VILSKSNLVQTSSSEIETKTTSLKDSQHLKIKGKQTEKDKEEVKESYDSRAAGFKKEKPAKQSREALGLRHTQVPKAKDTEETNEKKIKKVSSREQSNSNRKPKSILKASLDHQGEYASKQKIAKEPFPFLTKSIDIPVVANKREESLDTLVDNDTSSCSVKLRHQKEVEEVKNQLMERLKQKALKAESEEDSGEEEAEEAIDEEKINRRTRILDLK
jgi:hypothetical protein